LENLMPTYFYVCSNCEETKEVKAEIKNQPEAPNCNKCKELMVRRYGLQTVRFVGGGWGKDAR